MNDGPTGIGLIDAAAAGDVDSLRALLETSELDLNVRDARGRTALMAHGADVTIADGDGVTPLQHARQRGYREIEAQLVAAGAE